MSNTEQSVADLTALLEAAKRDERNAEEKIRKAKDKVRKTFLATRPYIYTVTKLQAPLMLDWREAIEIKDRIYISQKIDFDAYTVFTHNQPSNMQDILEQDELDKEAGMKYYLTADGIIHHTGGGTLILKTPQLCSPDEWAQIKSGNIPAKFLREANNA